MVVVHTQGSVQSDHDQVGVFTSRLGEPLMVTHQ